METTAREFTRNFRQLRAAAARGQIVRVRAPDGVFLFMREKSAKTCGSVIEGLKVYAGKGFLTEEGATALAATKRKPAKAVSPWDSAS